MTKNLEMPEAGVEGEKPREDVNQFLERIWGLGKHREETEQLNKNAQEVVEELRDIEPGDLTPEEVMLIEGGKAFSAISILGSGILFGILYHLVETRGIEVFVERGGGILGAFASLVALGGAAALLNAYHKQYPPAK